MRRILSFLVLGVLCLSLAFLAPVPTEAQQNPCVFVNLHPNQSNLPTAQVNQPYNANFFVTPANPCIPIIWTVAPPPPANLTLNSTSATSASLSGTPLAIGTYTFTVTAQCTYVCGTVCFLSQSYTLVVQ